MGDTADPTTLIAVPGQLLDKIRVDVLDFRGQIVSTGGDADTQTGEFIAY